MSWSGPRLTPSEVAAFGRLVSPSNYTIPQRPEFFGPEVTIGPRVPEVSPWLRMDRDLPRRRLDGSLLDSRPPESYWNRPVVNVYGWPRYQGLGDSVTRSPRQRRTR